MRRADHSLTFIVACGPESTRAVFSSAQINISVLQVFKLIIKVSINSVLSINLWQLDSVAFELLRCKFLVDQIVYFSFTFKRRRNGKILLQRWRIEAIIHDILLGVRCFIRIDPVVFHHDSLVSCLFRPPVLTLIRRTKQVHRSESHSTIIILAIIIVRIIVIVIELLCPVGLMPSIWSVHIAC